MSHLSVMQFQTSSKKIPSIKQSSVKPFLLKSVYKNLSRALRASLDRSDWLSRKLANRVDVFQKKSISLAHFENPSLKS